MRHAGGYQLEEQPIARGAQGAVHLGVAPDGAPVAVKIATAGATAGRALRDELKLLRHMNQAGVPNVVEVLDAIEVDGRPAMVMPRYPSHLGEWLQRTIRQPEPGALADIFARLGTLARTLATVHRISVDEGRVVHRDVKPENVFLDVRGQLRLGDFGGAMAVEHLRAVELALFGTPMWAPLDQLLPGLTIPDPTWDTYATCVILYAAVTGNRPAYQADPRELLTPRGVELWTAAQASVGQTSDDRAHARRRFATMRRGTTAADLVDLTGRAALVDGDREAIDAGVQRLCRLDDVAEPTQRQLQRGLWNLLVRGLSPLSHPSPPNRFRDAAELAEAIEALAELLPAHAASPLGALLGDATAATGAAPPPRIPAPAATTGRASAWPALLGVAALLGAAVLVYGAAGAGLGRLWRAAMPLPERVQVSGGTLRLSGGTVSVPPFLLDATEVTGAGYARCVAAGACATLPNPVAGDAPASPLSFEAAEAVCAFRGGHVPSEAQWRLAHGDGAFPWGDAAPTCRRAIGSGCADAPMPVGSARRGLSADGAADLAGNVWEWVRGTDGEALLLGGSVRSAPAELGWSGRRRPGGGGRPDHAGARCAYKLEPT